MASKRRYQCLNPECKGSPSKNHTHIFCAMNDAARCPACSTIKLADWGPGESDLGWERVKSAHIADMSKFKQTNDAIQGMADQAGVTNMSNKDGKSVKSNEVHSGPNVAVGGINVPMSAVMSGACVNVPSMAQKLTGKWAGTKGTGSLKSQTEVIR